jgi:hypothetical protein
MLFGWPIRVFADHLDSRRRCTDGRHPHLRSTPFFVSRRRRDSRYLFKAQLIREAIDKKLRGYQADISPAMTQFVKDYCACALRISPSCGVQEAKPRPEGSAWVLFKPSGFPGVVSLYHQLTRGFVKLLIAGAANQVDALRVRFEPFLTEGVEFGTSGKSLSLSISVPKVNPLTHSFKEEAMHVREGIAAIDQLANIYRQAMVAGN